MNDRTRNLIVVILDVAVVVATFYVLSPGFRYTVTTWTQRLRYDATRAAARAKATAEPAWLKEMRQVRGIEP